MSSQLVPGSKLTDTKISKDMVEEESNEILVLFYGVYHAGKKRIKNTKITLFHFDTFNEMKQKEIKL